MNRKRALVLSNGKEQKEWYRDPSWEGHIVPLHSKFENLMENGKRRKIIITPRKWGRTYARIMLLKFREMLQKILEIKE